MQAKRGAEQEPADPPFACTLIRSARRSMAIEVTLTGQVIVRVPNGTSESAANRFILQYRGQVLAHLDRIRDLPVPEALTGAQIAALYAKAQALLPGRVAHYASLLGQSPKGITVTAARTRFGSCSSKGSLCFSYHLMRYPEPAIDYVVLHEVAHLIHPDHSSAFYQIIQLHMPDYRQQVRLLRQPPPATPDT
ncbi:MAG: M48 family metallopeptidase [Christensenellales bacterium]